jgi:hypothetical protein
MKKIFPFLAAMVFIATACGDSMSNAGPKEVLVTFFERLSKKDLDGAAKLATKESQLFIDQMRIGMAMAEKMKDNMKDIDTNPSDEFRDVEMGDAQINGDLATVPVKSKKGNTEFAFPVKKEDGAWKVDFTMKSMAGMTMTDENKKNLEDFNLNGVNMDSLQQLSMKMMDSALKNIDPKQLEQLKNIDPRKMEEAMKALEKMKEAQKQ